MIFSDDGLTRELGNHRRAVGKPRFLQNVVNVIFDRGRRERQMAGDRLVGHPSCDKDGNFPFAWGKACEAVRKRFRCANDEQRDAEQFRRTEIKRYAYLGAERCGKGHDAGMRHRAAIVLTKLMHSLAKLREGCIVKRNFQ